MPFKVAIPGTAAAASGEMKLLYSQTVSSGGASSINTGTLATGYDALVVYAYLRTDTTSVSLDGVNMYFNGDTSSGSSGNYELATQYGGDANGGGVGGSYRAAIFTAAGHSADANFFNVCSAVIPQHESAIGCTQVTATLSRISKAANERITHQNSMVWKNTAAVSSITFSPTGSGDFVEGSAVFVYGVKS